MKWKRIDRFKPAQKQEVWYWFEIFQKTYAGFYRTDSHGQDMFYGSCGWLTGDVTYWMPRYRKKPRPPTVKQRKQCIYNPLTKGA
jgi:hypothetical protein